MFTIRPTNGGELRREIEKRLRAANLERYAWLRNNPVPAVPQNFFAFADQRLVGGAVEDFAREQRLVGVRLETADFQARGFYEKVGYRLFGELADCPPGHALYLFHKTLN